MSSLIFQQAINALTVGSIYALIALGYTMVYGVLRLINFAHSELFTSGAFLGLFLTGLLGVAGISAAAVIVGLLTFVVIGLVGVSVEIVAYRPLRRASRARSHAVGARNGRGHPQNASCCSPAAGRRSIPRSSRAAWWKSSVRS